MDQKLTWNRIMGFNVQGTMMVGSGKRRPDIQEKAGESSDLSVLLPYKGSVGSFGQLFLYNDASSDKSIAQRLP
jgi:hypothetical protein